MESARYVHHAPAFSRRLAEFCVECRSAAHITERQFTAKAAKRPKPPLFTYLSPATSWGLARLGHAQGLPNTYFYLVPIEDYLVPIEGRIKTTRLL